MREMKFRAWDVDKKCFHSNPYFRGRNGHLLGDDEKNIILQQFTGLKDKNGKEIYEGDIVEQQTQDTWLTYLVEWEKYDCAFRFVPLNFKGVIHSNMGSIFTDVKVIGSIHEDPEMFK